MKYMLGGEFGASAISNLEQRNCLEPPDVKVTFTPVSGVGSEAVICNYMLGGDSRSSGSFIFAYQGMTSLTIRTLLPAATPSQLESLANQLLFVGTE